MLDRAIKALNRDASERLMVTILRESRTRVDEVLSLNIGDVKLKPGRKELQVVAFGNKPDCIMSSIEDQMPATVYYG